MALATALSWLALSVVGHSRDEAGTMHKQVQNMKKESPLVVQDQVHTFTACQINTLVLRAREALSTDLGMFLYLQDIM